MEYRMDAAQILNLVGDAVSRGENVVLCGMGISMEPTIHDGERVELAPLPKRRPKIGDIYLYRRENGQAVIHRVLRVHKDCCDMRGDGQAWVECGVPMGNLVAYVTQIFRQDGAYRCDLLRARLRARLRMRLRPLRHSLSRIRRKLFKR